MPTTANPNDRIAWLRVSSCYLPLAKPVSDAKVLTGRQKPMTEIAMLFAEVETTDGHRGLGFSYSKRAGGPGQFAHAKEIAPVLIGEDPSDIAKLWMKLCWAGASVGRSGLSTQAIGAFDVALYDLKAKRAGLSLNEPLEIKNGRMIVPMRLGLGVTLSEQAQAWTRESAEVGKRA